MSVVFQPVFRLGTSGLAPAIGTDHRATCYPGEARPRPPSRSWDKRSNACAQFHLPLLGGGPKGGGQSFSSGNYGYVPYSFGQSGV
eukprot:15450230-Alexandrium_andersonii.AAC.1